MASNPLNLALRFILEITALFAIGFWGWNQSTGVLQYLYAIGLPIIFGIIWGVFAVKDDPSRSGKTIIQTSGIIRLFIELIIFGFACWSVYDLERTTFSIIFAVVILFHYLISFDRIIWLIKHN